MLVPIYENPGIGCFYNTIWYIEDFLVAMDMLYNPDKYLE